MVENGTTVQSRRPCDSLREITTTGRFLTISGGLNPVSKSQIRTSPRLGKYGSAMKEKAPSYGGRDRRPGQLGIAYPGRCRCVSSNRLKPAFAGTEIVCHETQSQCGKPMFFNKKTASWAVGKDF